MQIRHSCSCARPRMTGLWIGVACALMAGTLRAETIETDFGERWVERSESLRLRLGQQLWADRSNLRVFVGKTDISALVRGGGPGELIIDPRLAPLPAGESEIILWKVDGGNWSEVARTPVKVLAAGGFQSLDFDPKVELQLKGRAVDQRLQPADESERTRYLDSVSSLGFSFSGERAGTSISASASLSGTSYRPEALRYGELEQEAPKLDLAEYAIEVRNTSFGVRAGHISYGNHPLLLDSMSSRGFVFTGRPSDRFDLSLNVMNGTEIVGYQNFLGLRESDHRVHGLTAGYELIADRPGGLRAEISLMNASIQSKTDFNAGQIGDAERSRGYGVRLLGETSGGRMTADLAWAHSVYVNPFDPLLAQGEDLQPVNESRSNGRIIELGFKLLDDAKVFSDEHGAGLKLSLHHDRIAPLYKSIGSFFATDQLLNRATLDFGYRGLQMQALISRKRDNLDDIATLLTTRSDTRRFSMTLPLPDWLGEEKARSRYWPTLNYSYDWVHQIALNVPVTEDSGFAASHLPDQLNRTHRLDMSWVFEPVTLTYGINATHQDNRQIGRQNADFKDLGHELSASWTVSDALSLTSGLGRTRNTSLENNLTTYATHGSIGADWSFAQDWQFAFNIDKTLNSDSNNAASARNTGGNAQLGYRFEIADGLRKMPGQIFVRYSRQDALNTDTIFDLRDAQRHWYVDVGISLSLF
ncbi:MAG: hypothetical protein R3E83_01790 [Burkholderiaceae bacterium]